MGDREQIRYIKKRRKKRRRRREKE